MNLLHFYRWINVVFVVVIHSNSSNWYSIDIVICYKWIEARIIQFTDFVTKTLFNEHAQIFQEILTFPTHFILEGNVALFESCVFVYFIYINTVIHLNCLEYNWQTHQKIDFQTIAYLQIAHSTSTTYKIIWKMCFKIVYCSQLVFLHR